MPVDPAAVGHLALGATALGVGADVVRRIVGPPADRLGDALARLMEQRTANVGRVLASAERKLGDRISEPGQVPTRVAAAIFEQGSYCEDELMAEYLGGILASARTEAGRDDRAARWVTLVTGLSTYEIRLHYALYAAARAALIEAQVRIPWGTETSYPVFDFVMSNDAYDAAMEFEPSEPASDITTEALFALSRENLLTQWRTMGADELRLKERRRAPNDDPCLIYSPTTQGVQLYMWGLGLSARWRDFEDPMIELGEIGVPVEPARRLQDLELMPPE